MVWDGTVLFFTIVLLSASTFAGPWIGTPIILSLYLNPLIISTATFIATNSEPKVEVSTVRCAFEYQMIGALFKYNEFYKQFAFGTGAGLRLGTGPNPW